MTPAIQPLHVGHDVGSKFHEDTKGLVLEHAQEIPDSFVSMLRQMKADSGSVREKEFMHVGCIPVVFIESYLRKGFNIFQEDVRESSCAAMTLCSWTEPFKFRIALDSE